MKKSSIIKIILASLFCCFILSSCYEDYTHFYEDPQKPGLSIFSDKANNVMSCYVNGQPWRTYDRTSVGGLEVYISKYVSNGLQDTLLITWYGYFPINNGLNLDVISVVLPVPKNFSYKDFNNLQGKRLTLNATNGYFTDSGNNSPYNNHGTGNIFFHFAHLDTTSFNSYTGRMSGLFEADLGSMKIRNGRFDHDINAAF